jgi:hypothetical protein
MKMRLLLAMGIIPFLSTLVTPNRFNTFVTINY